MRTTHWLMAAIVGLLLVGCADVSTAPTLETRQALAPTGKLRVGLQHFAFEADPGRQPAKCQS